RLQHPRQPEVVVGVEVREEDLLQLDQADRGQEQLALRALAAVEQEALAAAAQEQRGRGAVSRRHRPGRAEEREVEVHSASIVVPVVSSTRRPGRRYFGCGSSL